MPPELENFIQAHYELGPTDCLKKALENDGWKTLLDGEVVKKRFKTRVTKVRSLNLKKASFALAAAAQSSSTHAAGNPPRPPQPQRSR